MKFEQEINFNPITITLETKEEADNLMKIVHTFNGICPEFSLSREDARATSVMIENFLFSVGL